MADKVANGGARTHANSLRGALSDVRAGDANLRIDAKNIAIAPEKRPYRALVREAMRRSGLSQKAFALDAKQPESVISEALNGSRALPSEWVWGQTDLTFQRELKSLEESELGLSGEVDDALEAQQIGNLVEQLVRRSFRVRREGAA